MLNNSYNISVIFNGVLKPIEQTENNLKQIKINLKLDLRFNSTIVGMIFRLSLFISTADVSNCGLKSK